MSKEKLITILEKFAQYLFTKQKIYQQKMSINEPEDYQLVKENITKRPLALYEMAKSLISKDIDIGGLIYLTLAHYFVERDNMNFLAESCNSTPKKIKKHARYLERKLTEKLGKGWFEKVYSAP